MPVYYVTIDGDRVAGPYETHEKAKQEADQRTTNEIGLAYTVETVRDEPR